MLAGIILITRRVFIHILAVIQDRVINRVFHVTDHQSIHAIFILPGTDNHVAILPVCKIIGVLTILASNAVIIHHTQLWHRLKQSTVLFKKWTRWIIRFTIILRVPCIRPPAFLAIHILDALRVIHGDNRLFAKIAGAGIVIPLIAKRPQRHLPTRRTCLRLGKIDLLIKCQIFAWNNKRLFAVCAIVHIPRAYRTVFRPATFVS